MIARLVRSEFTKLFTTKVWIGLLLGSCLLAGGFAALLTGFAGQEGSGLPPVGSPLYEQLALSVSTNATVFTLILGIIGMTQEYRHRTATPTFLTTPRRGAVVVAKLIAYALAAVPFAVVVVGVTVAVVAVYSGARGDTIGVSEENVRVVVGAVLAIAIYAVIGVGLGALLRNQVGAIVGALVYLFVIEGIVQAVGPIAGAFKWLPGGALEAMTATLDVGNRLSPVQGGLLLLAYGLVAALIGTLIAVRRDVS